jgi:alpha-tubulin suppressor-like RCC1 family protein
MGSKRQRCNRGPLSRRLAPLLVLALAGVLLAAVTAGNASGASLAAAWGLNDDGQLGNGSTSGPESCKFNAVLHACSLGAIPVSELSEVTAVAAGKDHSLALIEGGTVMAWGRNSSGQLGNGTTTGSALPVSVGGLSEVTAIAGGTDHSLALRADGTVYAWGDNATGELGNGTTTNSSVPVQVSGLTGVTAIAAGNGYSLALLEGGTVKAWGANEVGQLGNGTTTGSTVPVSVSGLTTATGISAGFAHSLAVLSGGTVKAWGYNGFGQLGNGTRTGPSKCTVGELQLPCAKTPVAVTGLSEATAVAAGEQHSLALKSSGSVSAWGGNEEGALGDGTFEESDIPVAVLSLTEATAVAAGGKSSMALAAGGKVMAWGANYYGQLGDNTTRERARPVMTCGLAGAGGIATRGGHSLAFAPAAPQCPTVTSISPTTGPSTGGTTVTITGSHLSEATAVTFGGTNAASFTAESPTTVTAVSPAGGGVVDVQVTTPLGTSAPTAGDRFTYQLPPKITQVAPNSGPTAGGTATTITGSSFSEASAVTFGSTPATSFTVVSATKIEAVSPAGTGTVDIRVTTPIATSAITAADRFTYLQLEAPEFGRCLKVPTGQGGYGDSKCTLAGGEKKYEWYSAFGANPLKKTGFTTKSNVLTEPKLTTKGGVSITCKAESGSGEYSADKSVANVAMTFTGCHRGELESCQTTGAAEGEIVTAALRGSLGIVKISPEGPVKDKIGLELEPASGETFAEFSCAEVPVVVTGSVIVEVKANTMTNKLTLKYAGAKGIQKPSRFEGGPQQVLRTEVGESKTSEGALLTLTTILTSEEKVEISSVV